MNHFLKSIALVSIIIFFGGDNANHNNDRTTDTVAKVIAVEQPKKLSLVDRLIGVPFHKRLITEDNSFICLMPHNKVLYGKIDIDTKVYTPIIDHVGTYKAINDEIIEINEKIVGENTLELKTDENGEQQPYWAKGKTEIYKWRYKLKQEMYMGAEMVSLTLMYSNGSLFTDTYNIYDIGDLKTSAPIFKDYKVE